MGSHGDSVPYNKYLKAASAEVFNWNLLNEVDSERHVFATIHKDTICDCGCYGRHTSDSMLGIFACRTQIMFDGVHPLARHDIQLLGAQRSLLVGSPLGVSGGLFRAKGD